MACKRSAVRSRLPPPTLRITRHQEQGNTRTAVSVKASITGSFLSPSSRGLGHHPFTVSTGVRIPLGTPALSGHVPASKHNGAAMRPLSWQATQDCNVYDGQFMSPSSRGLGHHPFTVSTGVRIPLGTPASKKGRMKIRPFFYRPLPIGHAMPGVRRRSGPFCSMRTMPALSKCTCITESHALLSR